jgi:hypothetical protein
MAIGFLRIGANFINIQKPHPFHQFLYFAQIAVFMSTRLMVDGQNQLHETRETGASRQPAIIRFAANIISYIFHPVFVPVMVVWFLVYVHPYLFAGFADVQKFRTVMMAVVSFTFFPLVTVLLLKGLKFIDTIFLRTQKDRVIPFIACMIWYFWISYVWFSFSKTRDAMDMPHEAVQFAIATFISTFIGLMVNIKMKVSLHTISAGIVLAFFILMAFTQQLNFGIWLAIVFLFVGLVCTARFIVSDHTVQEVYGGLAVGIISMLLAVQLEEWLSN